MPNAPNVLGFSKWPFMVLTPARQVADDKGEVSHALCGFSGCCMCVWVAWDGTLLWLISFLQAIVFAGATP